MIKINKKIIVILALILAITIILPTFSFADGGNDDDFDFYENGTLVDRAILSENETEQIQVAGKIIHNIYDEVVLDDFTTVALVFLCPDRSKKKVREYVDMLIEIAEETEYDSVRKYILYELIENDIIPYKEQRRALREIAEEVPEETSKIIAGWLGSERHKRKNPPYWTYDLILNSNGQVASRLLTEIIRTGKYSPNDLNLTLQQRPALLADLYYFDTRDLDADAAEKFEELMNGNV